MRRWSAAASIWLVVGLAIQPMVALALDSESILGAQLPIQNGGVEFSGQASPGAFVVFTRDGVVIGTQVAGADSSFDKAFTAEALGDHDYGVYAIDAAGHTGDTITNTVTILPAYTTQLSGYLLPPSTAALPNVRRPQIQTVIGSTVQNATVTTIFHGTKYNDTFALQTPSDASGNFANPTDTVNHDLHLGTYTATNIAQKSDGTQSPQSSPATFQVTLSADLNNDGRVNLTDFSILMFFYLQDNINRPADINDDTRTNLTDLSVMLFYFTG